MVPKLPVVGNQSVLQVSPSPGPSPPLASSTQQCRGSLVTWGLSQAKQGCGVLSGPCPQVEWLDPTVAPFLIFGKTTILFSTAAVKLKVSVTQFGRTLCDPMDCSLPAPLSMGFSRQDSWSGSPFPSSGDLPDPGMEPRSPTLQADSLPPELPGKPRFLSVITETRPGSIRFSINI